MKAKLLLLSFSITFLSTLLFFSAKPAGAKFITDPGTGGIDEYNQQWYQDVYDSPGTVNSRKWTMEQLMTVMTGITDLVAGQPKLAQTPDGPKYVRQGGATQLMAGVVTSIYFKGPASSIDYLADIGNNLGLIPTAYAQGLGFSPNGLSPLLLLWKLFRDITYLAFVVVFVFIGLMIMFRQKIDPQTVISIQTALPRIILALILVTFSYAIAGFIVDLGEIVIRLIANLLVGKYIATAGKFASPQEILNILLGKNVFELINPLRSPEELSKALADVGIGALNIPVISGLTVTVAFELASFYIMFKIFFALLAPYVSIILAIIFSPIQLMLASFPGTSTSLGSWLKSFIANVLVFPVTFLFLAIAAILKSGDQLGRIKCDPNLGKALGNAPWCTSETNLFETLWSPTTIGNWGTAVGHLAAFGILFAIPKVVEVVQQMLKVQPSPAGATAVEEIRAGFARMPLVGGLFR